MGDGSFQQKCINKIMAAQRQGKTILFASHDLDFINRHSSKILKVSSDGVEVVQKIKDNAKVTFPVVEDTSDMEEISDPQLIVGEKEFFVS